MAAAAGCVVMDTLTPDFLAGVREKGETLRRRIAAIPSPYIAGVRGMGLMVGVGIQNAAHTELRDRLMAAGLLTTCAGPDTIRLLPPLVITDEELERGIQIMEKTLQ